MRVPPLPVRQVETVLNTRLVSDSCVMIRTKMLENRGKMPLPHIFVNWKINRNMMHKNSGSGFQPRITCSAFGPNQRLIIKHNLSI